MKTKRRSSNAIIGEIKNIALVGGGAYLGALGGKAIDKALNVDETQSGFSIKKLAKPAAQLGLGIIGTLKLKDPNLKMLAAGVGVTGVLSAVNTITNKNILAGLAGFGSAGIGLPNSIYDEPMRLSVGRYTPDLPQLSSRNEESTNYGQSVYGISSPISGVLEADFEII